MSYLKSLKDVLKEKDVKLYNRLDEIEKQAKNVLQYAQAKFPYYTPHGFLHSENVLENLNWLLSEDVKIELNGHELFFLIISAWLHDWGMVGKSDEKPDEIRENHNIRTEEMFEKHYSLIGVHLNEARVIGRICRGHRRDDLYDDKYDDTPFEAGIIVHRRFLAAALRIADEVDVTAGRVPEIIYFSLNPIEKAEEEFKKQMNITGIAYPSEREKYKLVLSAIAWDPAGVAVLNKLRDKIQEELDHTKTILAAGINGKGLSLDYIELKIDTRGFMKEPIEFELDKEKILDLLIGRSLYPRKDVAIRELIQNAMDACRLRKALEGDYAAQIDVTREKGIIAIEDNGIGMDFATAKSYLSLVGASYYTSDEFKKLIAGSASFDPISRWGLGILSCFLVSSSVTIETKKANSQPCRFIIPRVDRGWRYEIGSTSKSGTKVSLFLNGEGEEIDVEEALNRYVGITDIPIFIESQGKRKRFVPKWNPGAEIENLAKEDQRIRSYLAKFGMPQFPLVCHLETDNFEAWFYGIKYAKGSSGFALTYVFNFVPCIHGIRINPPPDFFGFHSNIVCFLNIKKNIIDFEVSRESIIRNEKFKILIHDISLKYYNELKREYYQEGEKPRTNSFERDLGWISFLDSRLTERFFTPSESKEVILDITGAILSREGLRYAKLRSLIEHKPNRILLFDYRSSLVYDYSLYSLDPDKSDARAKKVIKMLSASKVLLQGHLNKGEVALFYALPYALPDLGEEGGSGGGIEAAFSEKGIECRKSELKEYAILCSKKIKTPIDNILPRGCSFAETPKEYSPDVLEVHPFSIKETSDEELVRMCQDYGGILLFEDIPEIFEFLLRTIPTGMQRCISQMQFGEYLIKAEQGMIQTLIRNHQTIVNDKPLLEAARIYVRCLVGMEAFGDPRISRELDTVACSALIILDAALKKQFKPEIGRAKV